MTKRLLVTSLACALLSTQAFAASFSINPPVATGPLGGGATNPAVITIDYAAEGSTADGIDVTLTFDDTLVDVSEDGNCNYTAESGEVTVTAIDLNSDALEDDTYCELTFTVLPGAPAGDIPLTLSEPILADDGAELPEVADLNNGVITVQEGEPDVTLSYVPAAGSNIVFDGGTQNDVVNESITVTAAGTIGSGTVTDCAVTGPNASAFNVASGDLNIAAGANDTIDIEATLDDAPISATLTCTETDSDSAGVARVWQLSAPAGTAVPSPGYASTPAAGTELTCNGSPGETAQTSITISNDGNPGVGSDLTFNCSATGAGFTVLAPAGDTLAVGESAQVTVECTVPAEDAPAIEGNLNCTSNDPSATSNDYPLSSVAETALPPVPQPNVVPASSMWSQLSLIGLLAALGLLVVGIRRKG